MYRFNLYALYRLYIITRDVLSIMVMMIMIIIVKHNCTYYFHSFAINLSESSFPIPLPGNDYHFSIADFSSGKNGDIVESVSFIPPLPPPPRNMTTEPVFPGENLLYVILHSRFPVHSGFCTGNTAAGGHAAW